MTKGKIQGKNTSAATVFTKQDFISALKKACRRVDTKIEETPEITKREGKLK